VTTRITKRTIKTITSRDAVDALYEALQRRGLLEGECRRFSITVEIDEVTIDSEHYVDGGALADAADEIAETLAKEIS
jgi:hypothetical protein